MSATMQGTRVEYRGGPVPGPGSYWKQHGGDKFFAVTPNGHLTGLANHRITEHEDGTITASPSILVSVGQMEVWHGFLERGVWRSC